MSAPGDVVVIGGGVNGLTAATLMAQGGRRVTLVERRDQVGGLAAGEEFSPGHHTAGLLHDTCGVRGWIVDALELGKHGLVRREAPAVLVPRRGAEALVLGERLEGVSAGEVERYRRFRAFLARLAPVVERWTDHAPPDLFDSGAKDLVRLGLLGFALRRLGRETMSEVLRIGPMSAADWLEEWFEDDTLRAALAAPAIWASCTGPRSPGTTANLLLAAADDAQPIAGGPRALVSALEKAARAHGVEILTGEKVETVLVSGQGAVGVRLAGGAELAAKCVLSSCDPRQLFLRRIPSERLTQRLAGDLGHFRARGTSARVDLALSAYPDFPGRPGTRAEAIRIGDRLEELERAFDAVKYRCLSERPLLEIRVPTIESPQLAPTGHQVFSILVHFAPHELEAGWGDASRERLYERVIAVLAEHAPAIRELVVGHRVLTPVDLERGFGLSGGHLFHGEHALDQLLVRPSPECARYATPISGLFLCGGGSHPGGGLSCLPGALGARAALASL